MKIKTNLTTGILMAVVSMILILVLPLQVRVPAFDTGAPSPRIIPYLVLGGMFICSVCLIIESVVMKKEKIFEFDIQKELPAIILIGMLAVFTVLIVFVGYLVAVLVLFVGLLYYFGERKPLVYIVSLVGGVAVYFLFLYVFNISLPTFPGLGG